MPRYVWTTGQPQYLAGFGDVSVFVDVWECFSVYVGLGLRLFRFQLGLLFQITCLEIEKRSSCVFIPLDPKCYHTVFQSSQNSYTTSSPLPSPLSLPVT